jgi:galactose mutarotase-like enzyme
LTNYDLDHVFGDLVQDASGRAVMTMEGKRQRNEVEMGPHYRAAVIYAPKATAASNDAFVCFEPMVGITDALNLVHKGLYWELQSIRPGQV